MSDRMKRTLIIETEVDRKTLNDSEKIVKGFFDTYSNKKMKVNTPDFQGMLQPIRDIEKEVGRVAEKMPHMLGAITGDTQFLTDIKEEFKDITVMFHDGSIAKGFDDIMEKSKTLAIKSVDLGDYLSTVQTNARNVVDALKEIGAVKSDWRNQNYVSLSNLNTTQLEDAIDLMQKLQESQTELDSFEMQPLQGKDLYSGTSTSHLTSYLQSARRDLAELKRLGFETMEQLLGRRALLSEIQNGEDGQYDIWEFGEIKEDPAQYDTALKNLKEYVENREDLLKRLQGYSKLFTADEYENYTNVLTSNINEAQLQMQELQQLNTEHVKLPISGDFAEVTKILGEIKESLQIISDVFKNESSAMNTMVEDNVTSFTSLSQAIIEVYNNLSRMEELVDSISQKDFNVTNITNAAPTSTSASKRSTVKQLKAEVDAEMQHVKALFAEYDKLIAELNSNRMISEAYQAMGMVGGFDESSGLPTPIEYSDFEQEILGGMADAKTKAKIENLLVLIDGYISKLTEVNKLREKYGLGEWQDPFVSSQQPSVQTASQTIQVPVNVTPISDTGVQSISNLEGAVDEVSDAIDRKNKGFIKEKTIVDESVGTEIKKIDELKQKIGEISKAIGRKNAGFIQEKDIVNTSVEAEKAKLRELISVITDEIGGALDGLKVKFEQSFVVPELDKNNLQASFDEIYNQFVGLKDKIGTMQIDVGINGENITTAIQEALYAKEIAANYKQVEFDDIFESQFDRGTWMNRFTGEIFDTFDDVDEEFDAFFKGLFKSKEGYFLGTKEEMFADFLSKQSANNEPEQNDWTQVVVEAINTQGGRIVESIKLLLPKNITDNVEANTINEAKLSSAFQVLVDAIERFGQQTGRQPDAFFRSIEANNSDASSIRTPEVDDALRTLGLLSNSGEIAFTMPDTGVRNIGVAIGEQLVASGQDKFNVFNASELMNKLNEAAALGASVPRIISLIEKSNIPLGWAGKGDAVFQLQTRSPGVNIASSKADNDFAGITDEQIDRLIHTFEVMSKVGLYPDFIGDNILLDKQKGFSLIDLETENIHARSMDTPQDMVQAFLKNVYREAGLSSSEFQIFSGRVNQRLSLPSEQRLVNADTIATEQMVDNQIKAEFKPSEVKLTPTMDEGAVAKVVEENVTKTPATVKVTPVIDSASDSESAIDGESQAAIDAAKTFVDAANVKKQFVEANKQVAKSAEESAKAVEQETKAAEQAKQTMAAVADNTVQPSNWDRVAQLQADHGEDPFALRRSKTENAGDTSVRTIVESWTAIKDKDGNLTGEMELNTVQIINDFKKRTDAITKESEKIKTAQAYLQKFLTQFNNKTMGKGSLLSGYQDLKELATRDNDDPNSKKFTIDDIAKAEQMMSNLDAEYNKVVQSMRKGSSSMNPFVNAINSMDKMEDVLRGISLQFRTLNQQPEWLNNDIIDLYKQLDSLAVETDIYKFAEGFGNLKVSINSVTESIRQQRVEQKLALSDFNSLVKATKTRDTNTEKAAKEEDGSAWKTYYLDRAAEQQKVIDAIRIGLTLTEAQEIQLNAMAEKHALILGDITSENNKIEEQKQKYEEIIHLLEKNRTDQIELDNDKSLNTSDRSAYQQILNEERAEIDALIASTDLNSEQTKSVKQLRGSIENDRIAKVKEYINLLKLKQDYEKKAEKEDEDSKMHAFYNDQVKKVKEKIKKIDIESIENQDEKNKRLAIEEAHTRAIEEIKEKQGLKQNKETEKALFIPQDKKIQEKFDAGYLNQDQYDDWRMALEEYQQYMNGVTEADETTIQNKKQSLMQMYDMLTKISNTSKSFFASGGEVLPKEMWLNEAEINDMTTSLMKLYNNISGERFEGMTTAVTRVRPELGKLFFTVDDGNGSLSQYVIHANAATGATKLLGDSTKPTLTVLQRFGQSLKKDFTGLLTAVMGGTSIHTFVQYMRKGVDSVRQLDLALTELKKVTDETEKTYEKFLDTAVKTGARIGSTLTDVTSTTAEFAKLGYNIEQAADMAESALVYINVGDNIDVETGSQSIISTMKAFGVEADNTMSIVDKFNEVGKLIAYR